MAPETHDVAHAACAAQVACGAHVAYVKRATHMAHVARAAGVPQQLNELVGGQPNDHNQA